MQAFPEFRHMPTPFWAMVKYVSETLGYTIRGQGIVRTYSIDEIDRLLSQNGIVVGYETIESAVFEAAEEGKGNPEGPLPDPALK